MSIKVRKNAADLAADVVMVALSKATKEFRTALRQESVLDIYLLVEVEDGDSGAQVQYRVTDGFETWNEEKSFSCFTKANKFYCEVVSSGSWEQYKYDRKRVKSLDTAGLYAYNASIQRKSDNKIIGSVDGGRFVPSYVLTGMKDQDRIRQIYAAVEKFMAVD